MNEVDQIVLNFSPDGLRVLNVVLAFIMFAVALDLRAGHFKQVKDQPKAWFLGIIAQLILLPLVTFVLILILQPQASIALGMIMVAACPGGNTSNFLTHRAGGNSALSVSMTAFSTLACIISTPLNVALWGGLYPPSAEILREIFIDPLSMAYTVAILLGAPLIMGMLIASQFPQWVGKYRRLIQNIAMLIFVAFIVIALGANWSLFVKYIHLIIGLVIVHNALALLTGYMTARMGRLSEIDRRALTIETGIQNSGLGLILIFGFFQGIGGMAIIAACWGIWHAISGILLATWWSRRPL